MNQYRTDAENRPSDPKAQFCWAYSALLEAARQFQQGESYWDNHENRDLDKAISWSLAAPPDPQSYEYARIRFLYEAGRSTTPELISLGERLLKRKPGDPRVLVSDGYMLTGKLTLKRFTEVIRISDELLSADPKHLAYIRLRLYIHEVAWIKWHKRSDCLATLAWCNRYRVLAPKSAWSKSNLEYLQALTKRQLARPTTR